MSTDAERRAVYKLAQPTMPLLLRTWHAAQIASGTESGRRGFLIGVCRDHPASVLLKPPAQDILYCVPVANLTGALTLHGGVRCPGADCIEGDPINLEVTP